MGFKWYDLLGPIGGAVGASLDKKEKKNIGKHALYGLGSNAAITGLALGASGAAPMLASATGGGALKAGTGAIKGISSLGKGSQAIPLNPVTTPNGMLGSETALKPITNDSVGGKTGKKSAFLQGASKSLGALGEGLGAQDNPASPIPFSPVGMNASKGVVSNPVDLPQVSSMPTPQQTPMPMNRSSNYNPLMELQKMIERQRAGY